MDTPLGRSKERIAARLRAALAQERLRLAAAGPLGMQAVDLLSSFSGRGKMLRGSLLLLSHRIFGGKNSRDALSAACALELLHSAILVHDDIIDRDERRRGLPTVHAQYRLRAARAGLRDATHTAEGFALCAADIGFFLAFRMLSSLSDTQNASALIALFSSEMARVCAAEMSDVWCAASPREARAQDILRIYRFKTARYTFSLPLCAGALLARAPSRAMARLARFGETAGMLFQLRDDWIGLFGSERAAGKSVGGDIREDKKTLHRHYLMLRAHAAEKKRLRTIFGAARISARDVRYVRALLVRRGVVALIEREMDAREAQALRELDALALPPAGGRALRNLLRFVRSRTA